MNSLALVTTALLALGSAPSVQDAGAPAPVSSAPQAPEDPEAGGDLTASVVKVFSQQRFPDYVSPWTKRKPSESTGSGVVIEGNRVLTNAHVVQFASRIELQPNRSSKKYAAKVVGIAPGIDLAVLEVTKDADEFFADRRPLEMQPELPSVMDQVNVYGYPMGGTDLSVTEGIISRIEYTGFAFDRSGLIVQIDAAINPGNSGGPAVVDGRLIGLATSRLTTGDDIGFLTPVDEIRAFLADIADGSYEGRPRLYGSFQTLENEALRERLGVDDAVTGLVVTTPGSDAADYPLRTLDVITRIGDHDIQVDGKVEMRADLRLDFGVLVPEYAEGGTIPLQIFRAGELLDVRVPVAASRELLVPYLGEDYPSYFIHGPLAFSPFYREFALNLAGSYPVELIHEQSPLLARMNHVAPGEELVMVLPTLFDHPLTRGYGGPQFSIIDTVNGTPIKSLRQLVEVLRDSTERFVEFRFAGYGQEVLVFDREELERSTEEILNDSGIRYRHSSDLDGVWPRDR